MNQEPRFERIIVHDSKTRRTRYYYRGGTIKHAPTPIAPLLAEIPECVGRCLPERHQQLAEILDSGIRIRLDVDRGDFYIASIIEEKLVVLGLAALERIWANAYFYLTLASLLPQYPKGERINLFELPETKPARDLATWALECESKKKQSPWPDGLPRPDWDAGKDENIPPVRMHFLHAICFLILHEMAHIVKQHPDERHVDRQTSYGCEFEADQWAADFMLADWRASNLGEKDFTGRCTGIALGLAMLAGIELHHRGSRDTHPTVAERLNCFFSRYDPKAVGEPSAVRDYPLYLTSVIVHWHLQCSGTQFDLTKVYDDTTDYLIEVHRAMVGHKNQ